MTGIRLGVRSSSPARPATQAPGVQETDAVVGVRELRLLSTETNVFASVESSPTIATLVATSAFSRARNCTTALLMYAFGGSATFRNRRPTVCDPMSRSLPPRSTTAPFCSASSELTAIWNEPRRGSAPQRQPHV